MHGIDLLKIDLNLLVVLEILLQEKSVARTAARIGRTPSATSHALSRLREELDDPILLRVNGKMCVTPRAARLGAELAGVLAALRRMLAEKGTFDPAETQRRFVLLAPDFAASFLPDLLRRMSAEAPAASMELRSANPRMLSELSEGGADLAIGVTRMGPGEGLRTQSLGTPRWAVFAREDHPAVERWSPAEWTRWPHLRVRTGAGAAGPVDRAAEAAGLQRQISLVVPHFLMTPTVLASSDALFTVPWEELGHIARKFGLIALEPPFEIEPISFALYWSGHLDQDPALSWFRRHVVAAFGKMLASEKTKKLVPCMKTSDAKAVGAARGSPSARLINADPS